MDTTDRQLVLCPSIEGSIPMPRAHREIHTDTPTHRVHAYLADFTNATEWDHGTVSCELVEGDGSPGSVYRNVSRFGGREVEVMYTLERADFPHVELTGRNGSTTLHDRIDVREHGAGSTVVYDAELTLSGPLKIATPVMSALFGRLADQTERTLSDAVGSL
ncbi:hypothetical protein GCM10009633_04070 [Janibacter melonis]